MKDRLEQLKAVRHPPPRSGDGGGGGCPGGVSGWAPGLGDPTPEGVVGMGGSSNPGWWRMGMSQGVVVTKPPPHGGVLGVGGHGDTHTPAAMVHMVGGCVSRGWGTPRDGDTAGVGVTDTPEWTGCVFGMGAPELPPPSGWGHHGGGGGGGGPRHPARGGRGPRGDGGSCEPSPPYPGGGGWRGGGWPGGLRGGDSPACHLGGVLEGHHPPPPDKGRSATPWDAMGTPPHPP